MVTPNVTFTNLKDWLDQALDWLRADGLPAVLQKPHDQLLNMMLTAKKDNRTNEVWNLIDRLERLALRAGDTREQGEIFIRCAKMEADLANLRDAVRLFQAAESKYLAFPHQRATVLWMMGCIHWVMRENVEGISAWQTAIQLFTQRKLNVQVDSEKAQWYIDRLEDLEKALAQAITTGELPACPFAAVPDAAEPENSETSAETEAEPSPETFAQTSSNPPSEMRPAPSFFEDDSLRWVSCQVTESIPAGGFGPTGIDMNPIGFLEFSEVLIEDEPYQVFSVRRLSTRRNNTNINSQYRYRAVHISGTSMNAARPVPIQEGDYVLIQEQARPDDNDIVVVEIVGVDNRATVKRFKRTNGKIQLIPESTDPKHDPIHLEREFSALDDDIKIRGVVIAVFKKKPC